ncbi:hypothetical protein [Silicimonas sp. MF1-12-2]|uniref:hypothetical protein n=1 Tax=Silicimonas sp. MF1-12-2 TaxID=3384793 RepID=UPI0039B3C27C
MMLNPNHELEPPANSTRFRGLSGRQRTFGRDAANDSLEPNLTGFCLAANARFRATDHIAAETSALFRFRKRRAFGSASLLRLQQPSDSSNWRGIISTTQADISKEILIGVAKVDIGVGAPS